jgi:hypothetical protein
MKQAIALLAQSAETPSGGAYSGWSAVSMLGMVLVWLLYKHIPALMSSHQETLANLAATNEKHLKDVTDHCKQEMTLMVGAIERKLDAQTAAIDRLAQARPNREDDR